MLSKDLAEELQKPIIEKFRKRTVYSLFIDNIWGADLADVQLISKRDFVFSYAPLIFSGNTHGLFLWKIKNALQLLLLFKKILDKSDRKPNKIWVDKGNEFYNRLMKQWLEKNVIEMCSIHNKEKSVVAEKFIRTLKNKIFNIKKCVCR